MSGRVLMGLVGLALTVFSFGIAGFHSAPAVWRHLLFAVSVVPLILAAMLYFVPVLTRTAPAPAGTL
jgi:hypothetical protein